MNRIWTAAMTTLAFGCGDVMSRATPVTGDASPGLDGTEDAMPEPDDAIAGDAAPTECDGYEPCGIHPVVVPAGYTLQNGVDFDEYHVYGSCTSFEDCGMWDTHFTQNWVDGNTGQPVDPYYNRMGSPFPWVGSRYEIDVAPGKISYATLKVTSPGELYVYSDGTPEMRFDRTTGTSTCFRHRAAHTVSAWLGNLGGTGNHGKVDWNISVLPGDMGTSGNASTCSGAASTIHINITADPALAATTNAQGDHAYCLLREGHTYYINFMSHGVLGNFDCSVQTCTMGGLAVYAYMGTDGMSSPTEEVPCP